MSANVNSYLTNYTTNMNLDDQADEAMYYFAYGSNMDSAQMETRKKEGPQELIYRENWPSGWEGEISPATKVGKAVLKGYKLNFNKQSTTNPSAQFASVDLSAESSTEGVLYKLDKKFIKVLDFYEGVASNHYNRELLRVSVPTQNKTTKTFLAFVYIAHPSKTISASKQGTPSIEYRDKLLRGAMQAGLSQETIETLNKWPTADQ